MICLWMHISMTLEYPVIIGLQDLKYCLMALLWIWVNRSFSTNCRRSLFPFNSHPCSLQLMLKCHLIILVLAGTLILIHSSESHAPAQLRAWGWSSFDETHTQPLWPLLMVECEEGGRKQCSGKSFRNWISQNNAVPKNRYSFFLGSQPNSSFWGGGILELHRAGCHTYGPQARTGPPRL